MTSVTVSLFYLHNYCRTCIHYKQLIDIQAIHDIAMIKCNSRLPRWDMVEDKCIRYTEKQRTCDEFGNPSIQNNKG